MDSFINKLDKNQREEVDNLSEEERIGLDVLFKTTVGVISKSIKDINFSDFEYVAGHNTIINLPEEVIELQDSASVSYNEAMNIFRNSIVGEEKQSKIFNDIFLNLIDIYMVETVKKYDNDFDRFVVIQRAIALADNIASHATYIESFEFPQFAGPTMPKFADYYSDAIYKNELFKKITTNMKSNAEFNRMKVEDVIGNIKQDGQKFTQQLDSTIESIKDITETMVTNVMDTKNLDPEEKPCENGICLKNLNSIMEKWQEIFEKIKDSKDIDKNFKEKLNDSLSIWKENIDKTINSKSFKEIKRSRDELKHAIEKKKSTRTYKFYNLLSNFFLGRNTKYKTREEISIEKKLNEKIEEAKSQKSHFDLSSSIVEQQILTQNISKQQAVQTEISNNKNVRAIQ